MSYSLLISGSGVRSQACLQWAPTLTVHDPNPPIVLETPVASADVFFENDICAIEDGVKAVTAAGMDGLLIT